jgi:hypothetical protein
MWRDGLTVKTRSYGKVVKVPEQLVTSSQPTEHTWLEVGGWRLCADFD